MFAHTRGSENLPVRPIFSEIWAWGGGTWGEGLGLMDWRLGGLEVCFYDVFEHIQSLRCVFTTCLRTSRGLEARRTFPPDLTGNEIWAWGGGTWGEGLAVLETWMLGDVFLQCV